MEIANISNVPHMVKLDLQGDQSTEIRVMPKARVTLPPGAVVNPRWLGMNPRSIHMFPEAKKQTAKKAPVLEVPMAAKKDSTEE